MTAFRDPDPFAWLRSVLGRCSSIVIAMAMGAYAANEGWQSVRAGGWAGWLLIIDGIVLGLFVPAWFIKVWINPTPMRRSPFERSAPLDPDR